MKFYIILSEKPYLIHFMYCVKVMMKTKKKNYQTVENENYKPSAKLIRNSRNEY